MTDISRGLPQPRPAIAGLPRYSRASGLSEVTWRASSNESTVPPSPAVVEAITRAGSQAHLYPSLLGDELVSELSARLDVGPDQVVVGAGSLAVLQQAMSAYTGHGTEVVYAWRSYEAYPIIVGIAGATAVPVPLTCGHRHDLDAMARAITPRTRAVIVCNPNNPTGTELTRSEIEEFVSSVPSHVLVILDEAYREFAYAPADGVSLMRELPQVAVFRTFSKAYGLAGLRAGYMVSSPEIAENVRAASPPFGLSLVAEAAAVAAWRDVEHTRHVVDVVRTGRERVRAALATKGVLVPPSGSNFVWIPVGERAAELEAACVRRGVSVRCFPGEGVRVTVGEPPAEDAVIDAVDELLGR